MRRSHTTLALVALLAATGTGCGAETAGSPSAATTGSSGDLPITQRAIAWVALQHLPQDTIRREAYYTDDTSPPGMLGADLRYLDSDDTSSDGDLVQIRISPRQPHVACKPGDDRCAELDSPAGTELYLRWAEDATEDPGLVGLTLRRDGTDIDILTSGQQITGDPRDVRLEVPLETMVAVVSDERLGATTSQEVLDASAEMAWDGGEPDPTKYDLVPSTDVGLAVAYSRAYIGYSSYSGLRPSPLKEAFGPGSIGSEFDFVREDFWSGTINVLAAPQAPDWLAKNPCDTPRFVGRCVDQGKGRYLAWVPGTATTGETAAGEAGAGEFWAREIWAFGLRETDVVAVRVEGDKAYPLPERRGSVELASDWQNLAPLLLDATFGVQTQKYILESDFEAE